VFLTFFPVFMLFVAVVVFVFATIGLTHLFGPKRKTKRKQEAFECGLPSTGDARSPFSVKYSLVAILFVLFDVEVIFFYPWAVNFRSLGWQGFWQVLAFSGVVLLGFVYVIKHRAIDFDKN
jgi:NADH-quinone oxidoreductase subunit A